MNILKNWEFGKLLPGVLPLLFVSITFTQPTVNTALSKQPWKAQWITHPSA